MTQLVLLVATVALAVGLPQQAAKPSAATSALQGTWIVESINGEQAPPGSAELTLTFSGDKYHQAVGAEVNERGSFKLAPHKPMTIDLAIEQGADAGKKQLGIVEVSGNGMRMSLDTPGAGKRPTSFDIKDGVLYMVAKKKRF